MAMRAALRRVLPSSSMTNVIRKEISTKTPLLATSYDPVNPAAIERTEGVLSESLAVKEKGSWTELNKEDKIALYRSQFPQTMIEGERKEPEAGKIVFGVTIGVSVALLFFAFLKKFVAPNPPYTLTQEWRDAQEAKMKLYRMNPITGISSK